MTRKKNLLLVALMAGLLSLLAMGCGGTEEPSEQTADSPAPAEPTTEDSSKTFKVALITDTGGVNDRGFNEFSIAGLTDAQDQLGVETRVYISESEENYLPNLVAAADSGYDLIISVGFLLATPTIEVASQYPNVYFAGVDHFYGPPGDEFCEGSGTCVLPNTLGLQYPSEEAGYLAGIVAALTSKSGTISTVGGIKIPPVDNWIAGFQQGALSANPDIKLLNAYSQDFVDQAKCKEIALDQIAQGSDIVFQVAGLCGLGALDAANEQGAWGIGVDSDQSFAGDHILTSALKPLRESVFETIRQVVDGEFQGGQNFFFSVQEFPDAQLLSPFNTTVSQEAKDAVEVATEQLISGEIDPTASVEEVGVTE